MSRGHGERPSRAGGRPEPEPERPASRDPWRVTAPDGTVTRGWMIVPLRLFLGVTFAFAGLQKLANPEFFRDSSPTSIHAQLVGAQRSSPVHGLAGALVHVAPLVGVVIALGELAIGLGVLAGLWTRVAAVAGMVLSFGLFLTVSFHARPYFTGSDIVFFFAWTPLALAGAAGGPSVDAWLASRRPGPATRRGAVPRRTVLSNGVLAGAAAAVVVAGGGLAALIGRLVGGTGGAGGGTASLGGSAPPGTGATSTTAAPGPSGTTTPTTAALPAGRKLGPASTVPVGGAATFQDPATGDPGIVIQRSADHFVAFDAVCPHAGCTVGYARSAGIIACPCHGSEFNAQTGAVENGPAPTGLTPIRIAKGSDGNLYVDG